MEVEMPLAPIELPEKLRQLISGAHFEFVEYGGQLFLRKIESKSPERLKNQFDWLNERQGRLGIPHVREPLEGPGRFSYDIEFFTNCTSLDRAIENNSMELLERLFRVLESSVYADTPVDRVWANFADYLDVKLFENFHSSCQGDPALSHLAKQRSLVINGVELLNFSTIESRLRKVCIAECSGRQVHAVHGDLTAENILITESGHPMLIDANPTRSYNHPAADAGKLFQSFDSRFERISNHSTVNVDQNRIQFEQHAPDLVVMNRISSYYENQFGVSELDIRIHQMTHLVRTLPYLSGRPKSLVIYAQTLELAHRILGHT